MPVDSPTPDGGVPHPEETDARGTEGESGASEVNESHGENASSNTNAASEKGAIGSLIVAVFSFAAMTMGMDPSELQLQQPKNDADSGHLQSENENKSLSNETAGSTKGNSSGHGNQTKGKKSDVKMKKQILDAGSLLTATVGLNAKMKQHTIIEMEDNISPNVKDDVIPPDLKKFNVVQFDNKSPKGTKHLAKHAVENSALPIKAASHQQLLDAFKKAGKSVESEKKEDQLEKVSGSGNFMERALNVPIKTGAVALVTSMNTEPEESGLKNEIEISTIVAESETQQNGSTKSDNKVKPFNDASPQSTTSGSEDVSELASKVKADGKRRESFSFRAVAWALATMTMHPPVKIKVTPKDQQEENMSLRDLSSSVSDKDKPNKHESDDLTGNSMDKSPRENETPDKSNIFIEDDAKPGPSRMAKLAVGGPENITSADFDDGNDDESKMQEERITTLNEEEIDNAEIEMTSDNLENGDIQKVSTISRGTQTTELDFTRAFSSSNSKNTVNRSEGKCYPSCVRCMFYCGEDQNKIEASVFLVPPKPGKQIAAPTETNSGFWSRFGQVFTRHGRKTQAPDVENQLQVLSTRSSVSNGNGRGEAVFSMEMDAQQGTENSIQDDMNVLLIPSNKDRTDGININKQQSKTEVVLDIEEADEVTWTSHHYEDTRQNAAFDAELQKVTIERAKKTTETCDDSSDINHQESMNNGAFIAVSHRETQTEEPLMTDTDEGSQTAFEQPCEIITNSVRKWWQSTGENEIKDQFEQLIKCDAKLGLSTFTVDDDGELKDSRWSKAMFTIVMLLALFNIWKQICNTVFNMRHDKKKKDKALYYFEIAFYISVFLLLLAHIFLNCFGKPSVGKAVKRLRRTSSPKKSKSKFSAWKLRMSSVVTGVSLILSGSTSLKSAKDYSIENIWEQHEYDLYRAVLAGRSVEDSGRSSTTPATTITTLGSVDIQTMTWNLTTSPALKNSTWLNSTLDTNITANAVTTTTPDPGVLLQNSYLETVIFGNLSVALDLIGQIIFSSAPDYLLVIAIIIWAFVESALRVDHLTIEDEHGNPLDTEELERRKVLAKKSLEDHDEFMEVSSELNGVGKLIWPALLLCAIFMFSYLVHLLYTGNWFMAIYYAVILSKIIPIFYIGGKIAHRVDKYYDWMVSKAGLALLELDNLEFDRRKAEIKRRPIALGMGPTLVNVKFFFSFFGTVTSNIILLVQSFFSSASTG